MTTPEPCVAKEHDLCKGNGIFAGYKWKGNKLCRGCVRYDIDNEGELTAALWLVSA